MCLWHAPLPKVLAHVLLSNWPAAPQLKTLGNDIMTSLLRVTEKNLVKLHHAFFWLLEFYKKNIFNAYVSASLN